MFIFLLFFSYINLQKLDTIYKNDISIIENKFLNLKNSNFKEIFFLTLDTINNFNNSNNFNLKELVGYIEDEKLINVIKLTQNEQFNPLINYLEKILKKQELSNFAMPFDDDSNNDFLLFDNELLKLTNKNFYLLKKIKNKHITNYLILYLCQGGGCINSHTLNKTFLLTFINTKLTSVILTSVNDNGNYYGMGKTMWTEFNNNIFTSYEIISYESDAIYLPKKIKNKKLIVEYVYYVNFKINDFGYVEILPKENIKKR